MKKNILIIYIAFVIVLNTCIIVASANILKAHKEKPVELTENVPVVAMAAETKAIPEKKIEPIVELVNLGEFKLTAYCSCDKCCGVWAENRPKDENGKDIVYTSTGTVATAGRTIAVDPSVIPYGTEVEINGLTYVAEDCGGAIKQKRIDVYFDNHKDALIFGVQYADVYIYS